MRWRVKQFPDILPTPFRTTDIRNAVRLISHMIPVSNPITRSYKTRAKSNFQYLITDSSHSIVDDPDVYRDTAWFLDKIIMDEGK